MHLGLSVCEDVKKKYGQYVENGNFYYATTPGTALIEWFLDEAVPNLPDLQKARNGHEIKDALDLMLRAYKLQYDLPFHAGKGN